MGKGKRTAGYSPTENWPRKGPRRKASAVERMEFAQRLFGADPDLGINGKGGAMERMKMEFGLYPRAEQLLPLRAEARSRRAQMNPVLSKEQVEKMKPPLLVVKESAARTEPEPTEPEMPPAPGTTRSHHDAQIRYDFAREYLRKNPKAINEEIIEVVRTQFGMGIDASAVGSLRRELGVGIRKKRRTEASKAEVPARRELTTRSDAGAAVKAALSLLLEEVPGLRSLSLTVDDDGRPSVSFEVATVAKGKVML